MEGREEAITEMQMKWMIVSSIKLFTQELERGWSQGYILERLKYLLMY